MRLRPPSFLLAYPFSGFPLTRLNGCLFLIFDPFFSPLSGRPFLHVMISFPWNRWCPPLLSEWAMCSVPLSHPYILEVPPPTFSPWPFSCSFQARLSLLVPFKNSAEILFFNHKAAYFSLSFLSPSFPFFLCFANTFGCFLSPSRRSF